jgi:hypothetical protein
LVFEGIDGSQPSAGAARQHHAGRHVGPAPTEKLGDEPARQAAEEYSEKQAGEQRAHHAPALLGRRELRGERDHQLGEARGDADDEARRDERGQRRRGGHDEQGDDQHRELDEDQAPLVEAVAERNEKKSASEKSAESERRHPAHGRRVGVELRGEGREHGRLVVDGPGAREHRHREEDHQLPVEDAAGCLHTASSVTRHSCSG